MKNLKSLMALLVVIILRLLPHPPNFEPITATIMPFSRSYGIWWSVLFAVSAVLFYDLLTMTLGVWSLFTAGCYALLAVFFTWALKFKANNPWMYVVYGAIATVFYDLFTAYTVSVLIYKQDLMLTLIGQIPFTINHLLSTVFFGFVLSPWIDRWFVSEEKLSWDWRFWRVLKRV
ncbi:hypothetical protein HOH51_03480 [bacterium]|jgi:hypothetical protein|nr:hypothetical protein [bacterium]